MKSKVVMHAPAFIDMPATEQLLRQVHENFYPLIKEESEKARMMLQERERLGLKNPPKLNPEKGAAEAMAVFVSQMMPELTMLASNCEGNMGEMLKEILFRHSLALADIFGKMGVYDGLEEEVPKNWMSINNSYEIPFTGRRVTPQGCPPVKFQ